jgi:hypothetical protein
LIWDMIYPKEVNPLLLTRYRLLKIYQAIPATQEIEIRRIMV